MIVIFSLLPAPAHPLVAFDHHQLSLSTNFKPLGPPAMTLMGAGRSGTLFAAVSSLSCTQTSNVLTRGGQGLHCDVRDSCFLPLLRQKQSLGGLSDNGLAAAELAEERKSES